MYWGGYEPIDRCSFFKERTTVAGKENSVARFITSLSAKLGSNTNLFERIE